MKAIAVLDDEFVVWLSDSSHVRSVASVDDN